MNKLENKQVKTNKQTYKQRTNRVNLCISLLGCHKNKVKNKITGLNNWKQIYFCKVLEAGSPRSSF